jgi:hypothetical protein
MKTGFGCQYRDLAYDRMWIDGFAVTFDPVLLEEIQERAGIDHTITGALSVPNSNNTEFTLYITAHPAAASAYAYYEEVK